MAIWPLNVLGVRRASSLTNMFWPRQKSPPRSLATLVALPWLCWMLVLPVAKARDVCESPYRPWKACIESIERCESGYCVLKIWFVVAIAVLGAILVLLFIACALTLPEGLMRLILMAAVIFMTGILGVILTGIFFAYS